METLFDTIWDTALPYQDHRDDTGHAAVTRDFAKRLVALGQGQADVVIPAITLHDTGWSQLTREERFVIFKADVTPEEERAMRFRHQEEGVRLAAEILGQVGYPTEHREEILEIISEHDTRAGFLSDNDGAVRDADKLWRFSQTGFDADIARFGCEPAALCAKLRQQIPSDGFFYSETAREIALEELAVRELEYGCALSATPGEMAGGLADGMEGEALIGAILTAEQEQVDSEEMALEIPAVEIPTGMADMADSEGLDN